MRFSHSNRFVHSTLKGLLVLGACAIGAGCAGASDESESGQSSDALDGPYARPQFIMPGHPTCQPGAELTQAWRNARQAADDEWSESTDVFLSFEAAQYFYDTMTQRPAELEAPKGSPERFAHAMQLTVRVGAADMVVNGKDWCYDEGEGRVYILPMPTFRRSGARRSMVGPVRQRAEGERAVGASGWGEVTELKQGELIEVHYVVDNSTTCDSVAGQSPLKFGECDFGNPTRDGRGACALPLGNPDPGTKNTQWAPIEMDDNWGGNSIRAQCSNF